METPIRNLETDAYKVVLPEPLGAASPWRIGKDMSTLFGGPPTIRQYVRKEKGAGRWLPKLTLCIDRYYHSPTLSVGVVSDGLQTSIEVDPNRPDLIAVVQAYSDWMSDQSPEELTITFNVAADELNGVIRGDNWVFSACPQDEESVRGILCATAPTYPARLQTVARGFSSIMNKLLPSGGEEVIGDCYAPGGIDSMAHVWQQAMRERDGLRAARIILWQYMDGV